MPELPEVEGFRQYILGTAMDQRIRQVEVRDSKVLQTPTADFQAQLKGRSFVNTDRIGKFMFLGLDDGNTLMVHFGMTGSPHYFRDPEDEPRFPRVIFHFDSGFSLAYNCPRKFGRLKMGTTVEAHRKERKLGPDARNMPQTQFVELLKGRKTAIKNALMNQSVLAGLGNWMVDEILYQAEVHPEERVGNLSSDELAAIHQKMGHVVDVALEHEAHYPDFPTYFTIHSRWTDAGRPDAVHIEMEIIKVGGRTTYFDPQKQVLHG